MHAPTDTTLLLFAAEALDPDAQAELTLELAADLTLRERLAALASELTAPAAAGAWRLPPPGMGLGAQSARPAVMGLAAVRTGDRFEVQLPPQPQPERKGVVVLRYIDGDWRVVFPDLPSQAVSLDRLPVQADGRHRIFLVARPPSGVQRWAVALVGLPADAVAEGAAQVDPWAGLRDGLACGHVPVGVVEIDVA